MADCHPTDSLLPSGEIGWVYCADCKLLVKCPHPFVHLMEGQSGAACNLCSEVFPILLPVKEKRVES